MHKTKKAKLKFREIFENPNNIKADIIIYLDAEINTLKQRYNNDVNRDMNETLLWYENYYDEYDTYWKLYPNVIFINTDNMSTEQIYEEVKKISDINN